ncbi:MAG: extracellular solute-binding protein [Clostridiales bacterium]|nr:extracellular solute-binding protein [Clostridiales bacterium]
MKKVRTILCTLMAALMVFAMLSGCGNSQPSSSQTEPAAETPAASAETPAPSGEKIQLTLGIYPADTDEALIEAHKVYMENYAKLRPDVEVIPSYYKYATDNFIPMAEAGTVPTIIESWYTEPQKLIRSGYIRDITDILKARGWYDVINPSIRDLLSADGKIYGLPRDGYALGLMLNVELFEEAGLVTDGVPNYPKTWEELAQTAKTIKEKTGAAGICLLAQDNAGGWHWSNIAWAYGATLTKDNGDGTFTANLNSPEAIAAMEYTKSLKWEYDVLTADPTAENWGTGFQQLGTGGAAMYIAANDAVEQPTANNGLPVDKLALAPVPAGPGGQYSLSGGTPYVFASTATDDEVNAALDYLIVMGKAPEVTTDARIGLENDAKYRVDNGIPVIPRFPCWNNPELTAVENEVIEANKNVDMRLYQPYYDATLSDGNLRMEEPGLTQDMYAELTKVLQAVLTDESADVASLMETANTNYQTLLNDAGIGK